VPASPFDPISTTSTSNFSTSLFVHDSLGGAHLLNIYYAKTAPDAWDYHLDIDGGDIAGGTPGTNVEVGMGSLSFAVDGALREVTVDTAPSVNFNGADPNQALATAFGVSIRQGGTGLSGMTQLHAPSTMSMQWQDGRAAKAP